MLFRSHGKLSFAKLQDATGEIQVMFHKDFTKLQAQAGFVDTVTYEGESKDAYKLLEKIIDMGDRIGVEGELFRTQKGELTILVSCVTFLSKAIRGLPDKHKGLADIDARYRQRYLDITMNQSVYDVLQMRFSFTKALREFYRSQGFIEVETPILGNAASGAAAKPFTTHHEDLDLDVFLRISPETALKKATVGRFEKIFEIAKEFRNEGSDPSHLQEFTGVEHYAAFRTYEDNMRFTEDMFAHLFDALELDPVRQIADKDGNVREVDFGKAREKIDYVAQVSADSGLDIMSYSDADTLRKDLKAKGIMFEKMDSMSLPTLIDYLYKKVTRPQIVGPAFVYNYPSAMQPLARRSDSNAAIAEQFQVVVNGREIIKAYSELVDPQLQAANFAAQSGDDEEATSGDDEFVLSMEYGMPPQSGFGMGIDRVMALLMGQDNLRDVILFPLMKPLHEQSHTTHKDAGTDAAAYGTLPSIAAVEALADKYLSATRQHCQEVADVMKRFAKKLNQPQDIRYTAGLLHDIDRDLIQKNSDKHLKEAFETIAAEIGLPQLLIEDIKSHGPELTGVPVNSLLRKYLSSVDELTGFIHAIALMRPEKFDGMSASSITKKMKDKKFAAGVDRDHLVNCEKYLNIPFATFAEEVLEAMKSL